MAKNFVWTQVLFLLIVFVSLRQGKDCVKPEKCVNLKKCEPLMKEFEGIEITVDTNIKLRQLRCGFEGKDQMVCCVDNNLINRVANRFNDNDTTYYDATSHPNFRLLPTNCGLIEANKIFGGITAELLDMPWMALFSYTSRSSGPDSETKCAGTIINELYILTAAHCVEYLGNLKLVNITVGEYDTTTDPDCVIGADGQKKCADPVQIIEVESTIPHPNYSTQSLSDDIALVRLKKAINFTSLLGPAPICLPHTYELQTENLKDVTALAAGWGTTELGVKSAVLRTVELPVWTNDGCKKINKRTIPDSQICAGGVRTKDTCSGDSGGPLLYKGSDGVRNILRGISSIGNTRCAENNPSIFTRVSSYIKWILDNMKE